MFALCEIYVQVSINIYFAEVYTTAGALDDGCVEKMAYGMS